MKRYDIYLDDNFGEPTWREEEAPDGRWVEYEEAQAERAELLDLLKEVHDNWARGHGSGLSSGVIELLKKEGRL